MPTPPDLSTMDFALLVDAIMDSVMSVAESNNRGVPSEFDLDQAPSIHSRDEWPPSEITLRDVAMEVSRRCTHNSAAWILSGRGREVRTPRRGDPPLQA